MIASETIVAITGDLGLVELRDLHLRAEKRFVRVLRSDRARSLRAGTPSPRVGSASTSAIMSKQVGDALLRVARARGRPAG